jgi:hypothetical protein
MTSQVMVKENKLQPVPEMADLQKILARFDEALDMFGSSITSLCAFNDRMTGISDIAEKSSAPTPEPTAMIPRLECALDRMHTMQQVFNYQLKRLESIA